MTTVKRDADQQGGKPAGAGWKAAAAANLRRRTLLISACGVVVMLGLGWIGAAGKQRALLRPPGGQRQDSFIAKCLKCDRCRSICPTSAIGVAHLEDGIINVRTPVMKFHLGHCTFCKKCVEVCPTQALAPFDTDSVRIGLATLTTFCIAWNTGGCTLCHRACPYGAIALDPHQRPVVDAARCNGCGLCEKICPALILQSYRGGTLRGIEVRPIDERSAT